MKIDAHCHTDCSDGTVTIDERIALIKQSGFDAGTITDHDFISKEQVEIARKAAGAMPFIPGIELSLSHNNKIVHLLGYFVDPCNEALQRHMETVWNHDKDCTEKLINTGRTEGISFGISDLVSSSLHTFYSGMFVKRMATELFRKKKEKMLPFFFMLLDRAGISYPSFSPWAVRNGIDLIHEAGGIAVLAHPGGEAEPVMDVLGFLRHTEKDIKCYADWGIDGVETHTPCHSEPERDRYVKIARKLGLLITGGSDCHGDDPYLGPAQMGVYNDFPDKLFDNMKAAHDNRFKN